MTLKTLQLSLGVVNPTQYQTGWYRDPTTGQYYYYDGAIGKWYIYTAGQLYALGITEQQAPKVVMVAPGDSLEITISYKYAGPASTGAEEYFSIGSKVLQYSPKIVRTHTRNLPVCATPTSFTWSETLVIPTGVGNGWTYIECKVWHGTPDVPETGIRLKDALAIAGIEPDITDFIIEDYVKV